MASAIKPIPTIVMMLKGVNSASSAPIMIPITIFISYFLYKYYRSDYGERQAY